MPVEVESHAGLRKPPEMLDPLYHRVSEQTVGRHGGKAGENVCIDW